MNQSNNIDSLSPYSSNSFKQFCVLGSILGPRISGLDKTQFCSSKKSQPERRADKYTENLGQITASSSLATSPKYPLLHSYQTSQIPQTCYAFACLCASVLKT